MTKQLLIIFAKNLIEGQVKTRLAKSIGNHAALQVYKSLLHTTEQASNGSHDTWVFYSREINKNQWPKAKKFLQQGQDLGEKMKHAFNEGFAAGYNSIVLIGSDLPDMSEELIAKAFLQLENHPITFGPATDGGYYLIGLTEMIPQIFENKPWSQPNLLELTLQELRSLGCISSLLDPYNDVDTLEDLIASGYLEEHPSLKQTIEQLND